MQAVAEPVDARLVPGVEQQHRGRHELVRGQPVRTVARRDEVGEQVVAGRLRALRGELLDVCRERPGRLAGRLLVGRGPVHLVHPHDRLRPRPQVVPVGLGDAEQLGDHEHRQRLGVVLDDVELAVGQVGQQPRGQLLDPRRQPLHVAAPERAGHQPPQPGVLGRLAVEDRVGVQPVEGLPVGVRRAWPEDPARAAGRAAPHPPRRGRVASQTPMPLCQAIGAAERSAARCG